MEEDIKWPPGVSDRRGANPGKSDGKALDFPPWEMYSFTNQTDSRESPAQSQKQKREGRLYERV